MDFIKLWAKNEIEVKKVENKIKYFFREKSPHSVANSSAESYYLQNKINENFNVFLTTN